MRGTRLLRIAGGLPAVVLLALSPPAFAQAFHEPGSLICSQCHTMHYSEDGAVPTNADAGGPFGGLLLRSSATSLCVACHSESGSNATFSWAGSTPPKVIVTGGGNQLPGGNFNNVMAGGNSDRGHSLNSSGFLAEAVANGPGGGGSPYPTTSLQCTSCHDAHGPTGAADPNVFQYRNLKKTVNSTDVSAAVSSGNTEEATLVTAGVLANQNGLTFSATNHNVYRGTIGAWCGGCHGTFHGDNTDSDIFFGGRYIRHPTDQALLAAYVTAYGTTAADDDYDPNLPVVAPVGVGTTGALWSVTVAHRVFCLSCHKAHATDQANSIRWDTSSGSGGTDNARGKCGECHNK
ncbi:MAG: hypothetical protein HYY16_01200 [Planctomycetes bacterium]|nr:hypothetical protein [Planctomycetota bacterium]